MANGRDAVAPLPQGKELNSKGNRLYGWGAYILPEPVPEPEHPNLIPDYRDLGPETVFAFAPLHRPQADLHFCTMLCRAFGASQHLSGDLEIFRGINRHGMVIGDNGLESKSVREEAQLFE